MPQSLAKILVHTVFSTKDRRPFLRDKPLREELHRYLGGILTNLDCQPIIVGGVEDHVHILCDVVAHLRGGGDGQRSQTRFIVVAENQKPGLARFRVAKRLRDFLHRLFANSRRCDEYIAGQEEHHRKVSFQDEFRQLLRTLRN